MREVRRGLRDGNRLNNFLIRAPSGEPLCSTYPPLAYLDDSFKFNRESLAANFSCIIISAHTKRHRKRVRFTKSFPFSTLDRKITEIMHFLCCGARDTILNTLFCAI